ncbi:hypothetical protein I3760_12G045000 [Carya illinoinensis]|nr:hypothetical protein I3760_12G045000 [Carya illinoinensis]
MVISGKRGRRGRIRPQRPLINSSQIEEAPARSLRDEEDPRVDDSREAVPAVGVEESIQTAQHDLDEGDNSTGRGPAKGTLFERLRKMGKIPLTIKDGHRGPSCENAMLFITRVSWIIRVHADMRHASWSVVDDKEKHELINRVRADFVLDWTRENHRKTVANALVDRYKAYHYELHKHYKKFASHEEALAGRKEWVEPHEQSLRNNNNRSKQKVRHTSGRKSFVRLMEERGEEASNMIEFYKETHWSSKKGKFINAASEHNYNLMLERLNEKETKEDIQEAAGDVFKEVMGFKSGYAQGLGHSVIPEPSPFMKKNKAFKRITEENERNKESADLYKSKLEALLGDMAKLRKQFSEHDKQIMAMSSQLGTSRESQQETQGDA